MRRNYYALLLLAVLAVGAYTSSRFVLSCAETNRENIQAAYELALDGNYTESRAAFLMAAQTAEAQRPWIGLFIRRSLLDKVNETMDTLPFYAEEDNTSDLAVEAARAQAQISQLTESFLLLF
jgi:hypothetical protein